jgi:hypothetical protein
MIPKRVVFFNYFHNGDVHVSRGLVRQIMNKILQLEPNTQFGYGHKNNPALLSDIPNLIFDPHALPTVKNEHSNLHKVAETVYVNTWYGQQNFKYMNRHAISFDTLYAALDDSCKDIWGFSLNDISTDPSIFFPQIDYDKFQIGEAKIWLSNHPEKKIFVSNGQALSDQSHNFPITPLIENLAKKHTDKTFILSNTEGRSIQLGNVYYSSNIIRKADCDLNENAFLSEQCDTIMGRASGAFAFAETYNNMFKRNCRMLCFTNITPKKEGQFWLGDLMQDKLQYSATITATNENDTSKVMDLMERNL